MAKQELRVSVQVLMEEKTAMEKKVINLNDKRTSLVEEFRKLREKQFSLQQAKETLSNKDTNKAPKLVLSKQITELQVQIEAKQKEVDAVSHDHEKASGELRNMLSAIKELENS